MMDLLPIHGVHFVTREFSACNFYLFFVLLPRLYTGNHAVLLTHGCQNAKCQGFRCKHFPCCRPRLGGSLGSMLAVWEGGRSACSLNMRPTRRVQLTDRCQCCRLQARWPLTGWGCRLDGGRGRVMEWDKIKKGSCCLPMWNMRGWRKGTSALG